LRKIVVGPVPAVTVTSAETGVAPFIARRDARLCGSILQSRLRREPGKALWLDRDPGEGKNFPMKGGRLPPEAHSWNKPRESAGRPGGLPGHRER
jgi:hypothetical protein